MEGGHTRRIDTRDAREGISDQAVNEKEARAEQCELPGLLWGGSSSTCQSFWGFFRSTIKVTSSLRDCRVRTSGEDHTRNLDGRRWVSLRPLRASCSHSPRVREEQRYTLDKVVMAKPFPSPRPHEERQHHLPNKDLPS